MTRDIALLGIFRSGTNFVRTVLEINYDCRLLNTAIGWKHGFYPSTSTRSSIAYPDLPVVVVVKSPALAMYSLHSYYRQRHVNIRASEEFGAFLRERIVFFDSFNRHAPEFRFSNPVQLWNGMNWHYASIKPRQHPVEIVRYEDVLADPEGAATSIATALRLERVNDSVPFFVPENRTRNMGDGARRSSDDYLTPQTFSERSYYLERGYLEHYTEADLAFLSAEVDAELLERVGYFAS